METQEYFKNYSPVGDLLTTAVCLVIFILLFTSYVNKNKAFGIYVNIVIYLVLGALSDVICHHFYRIAKNGNYVAVYITRILYHVFLFSILLLFVFYAAELLRLDEMEKKRLLVPSVALHLTFIGVDIVMTVIGKGFRLDRLGKVVIEWNVFLYGYVAFVAILIFMLFKYRERVFRRVMIGFYGTIAVSFCLVIIQRSHEQSSFTIGSFLFPTIAMLYMIHSNPYDIELGSISAKDLENAVGYLYRRKHAFIFLSLYLPDFDMEGKRVPVEIRNTIRQFSGDYFRGAQLFLISNGHMILMIRKDRNPDYQDKVRYMLSAFHLEYEQLKYDYKIVIGDSMDVISAKNAYVRFIKSIHRDMKMNEIHYVEEADVKKYDEYEFILAQLQDIYKRNDPLDERVLAYCQPVYNLRTQKYDTAEALMRLRLPEMGIVPPERFIPLAEENGYIHVLTMSILTKTCNEIEKLIQEGYEVNRISVNVSILEMRDDGFSNEIRKIIKKSGIPSEKVAIEITESQSDYDFELVKRMIGELKDKGIKFYLDDFGTGYSNMERILELPFDIIKFDRSLVLASDGNERSEKLISSLANMFSDLQYSVLYEGVETELDEERCKNMSANYLQGYKYSRPIPMEELRNFFSKQAV